jgi:hypothetical protein
MIKNKTMRKETELLDAVSTVLSLHTLTTKNCVEATTTNEASAQYE